MNPTALWRTVAIVASLGWGGTMLAWMATSPTAPTAPQATEPVAPRADRPKRDRARPRPAAPTPSDRAELDASPGGPDITQIRDQVRDEVWQEVEQERSERRRLRGERHLSRLLGEAAEFAETHGLNAATQAMLEASTIAMHERLEELRPDGPPGPDGPPPEALDAIETSFDAFRDEVHEALDDVELADAYTERMTPRPLRDRPRN